MPSLVPVLVPVLDSHAHGHVPVRVLVRAAFSPGNLTEEGRASNRVSVSVLVIIIPDSKGFSYLRTPKL